MRKLQLFVTLSVENIDKVFIAKQIESACNIIYMHIYVTIGERSGVRKLSSFFLLPLHKNASSSQKETQQIVSESAKTSGASVCRWINRTYICIKP